MKIEKKRAPYFGERNKIGVKMNQFLSLVFNKMAHLFFIFEMVHFDAENHHVFLTRWCQNGKFRQSKMGFFGIIV